MGPRLPDSGYAEYGLQCDLPLQSNASVRVPLIRARRSRAQASSQRDQPIQRANAASIAVRLPGVGGASPAAPASSRWFHDSRRKLPAIASTSSVLAAPAIELAGGQRGPRTLSQRTDRHAESRDLHGDLANLSRVVVRRRR